MPAIVRCRWCNRLTSQFQNISIYEDGELYVCYPHCPRDMKDADDPASSSKTGKLSPAKGRVFVSVVMLVTLACGFLAPFTPPNDKTAMLIVATKSAPAQSHPAIVTGLLNVRSDPGEEYPPAENYVLHAGDTVTVYALRSANDGGQWADIGGGRFVNAGWLVASRQSDIPK